jgi:hypothetical protein
VENLPELGVCERNVWETLVALGSERIELLPRTSSGKCGIGRRRRSVPPPNGLPGGGGGGQVTGPPGSEEPSGSTGSVTSTGHPVNRRASDSFRGTTGHQPKGPCRSYRRGPFTYFESRRPIARAAKSPDAQASPHSWEPFAVEIPALSVDTNREGVDDPPELEVSGRNVAPALVARGSQALELLSRTPSGESGIGRRRRSVPPPNGLPGGGGGGRVTRPPGSEEPAGSTGIVTGTGRTVGRRTTDLRRGTSGHHQKGPCRSYRQGPFFMSAPAA